MIGEIIQQALNTVSVASAYTIVAVGITVVFGMSQIVNFAYGDFLTLGGYLLFFAAAAGGLAFIYGFGVAVVGVAIVALLTERLLFRWTLSRPINGFLVSLGLIQIIESAIAWKYTSDPVTVKPPTIQQWDIHSVFLSAQAPC